MRERNLKKCKLGIDARSVRSQLGTDAYRCTDVKTSPRITRVRVYARILHTMKVEKSKYSFSSASKSKAWDLRFDSGERQSFRTRRDAMAAMDCCQYTKSNTLDLVVSLPVYDTDGLIFAVQPYRVLPVSGKAQIVPNNELMESVEVIDYTELLERILVAKIIITETK